MKKRYLSIRLNAILHLAGMFLLIAIIIFFTTRFIALRSAEKLDRNQAILQVQRIKDGLTLTAESIKQTATDWSKWDETFDYVEGTNPSFIDDNLYLEALSSIDMDYVLIYSQTGNLLFHQYNDFENEDTFNIDLPLINQISALNFFNNLDPNFSKTGLLTYGDQLLIISTSPIMRSNYLGQPNGTLIFIRVFDTSLQETIENIVGIEFSILSNQQQLDDLNPIDLKVFEDDSISIKSLLNDLSGNHDLIIDMTVPMETSSIVRETIETIALFVFIIMVSFFLIIIFMLDRQLFKRIFSLTEHVKNIKAENNIHLRVQTDEKQDEITYIANEINQMLDYIESSYEEINQLAYSDHLTGTHNRLSFYQRMEETIKEDKAKFSIFFLDLDGFKDINDKYGHEVGDSVLIEVSKRIQDILGKSSMISRAGGDEFLIYYPSIDKEVISQVCVKIIDTLAKDIHIDSYHLDITTSIGVAIYPNNGTTLNALIRHSDLAMYHAKELGKNQFQFELKKD